MIKEDDWRLTDQEDYLKGVSLQWKTYEKYREGWDHDHCEFCFTKFLESGEPDTLHQGYATEDNYRWICEECFEDFKDLLQWKVEKG